MTTEQLIAAMKELATVFRSNASALSRDAEADKMQSPELFDKANVWCRAAQGVEKIIQEAEHE